MESSHGIAVAAQEGRHDQPTVIAGCRLDMDIVKREITGPALPFMMVSVLDEAVGFANGREYGPTSSIDTTSLASVVHAVREFSFGETDVNHESFEAMQGFHAGARKPGIGGADGRHGVDDHTATHVACAKT